MSEQTTEQTSALDNLFDKIGIINQNVEDAKNAVYTVKEVLKQFGCDDASIKACINEQIIENLLLVRSKQQLSDLINSTHVQ